MPFPTVKTDAVTGDIIEADHINNIEDKVGTDGSADPNSLDYKLTNPLSISPGHLHSIDDVQDLRDELERRVAVLTFMFTSTASDIAGYYKMASVSTYVVGAQGDTTTAGVSTTPTLLDEFATISGSPNITAIPIGNFHIHYETEKVAGSNNYYTFARIYKRDSSGTETLLLTSDNSTETALNTVVQQTVTAFNSSIITLNATDRIVVKIYAVMLSSTATIHLYFDDNTNARLELPVDVGNLPSSIDSIGIVVDGGGGVVTTGEKGLTRPKYSGTITGWTMLSDIAGSCVIDVWKDTYANSPPTVADTIFGTKPNLVSQDKNEATGLSISFTSDDVFKFKVDSATTLTWVKLILHVSKA